MAFLRTLFWVVLTVIVVVFSIHNWSPVTIALFGDLRADVKLPVLLLIAFLLGFVPAYAWQRTLRWRDRRRVAVPLVPVTPTPTFEAATPGIEPAQAD